MDIPNPTTLGRAAAVILALTAAAGADTIVLEAVRDNTLYETGTGDLSNGEGIHLFAGRTGFYGEFGIRRALMAFDIDCQIPRRSTIQSATLQLYLSQVSAANPEAQEVCVSRVVGDWGEGPSNAGSPGGAGTDAENGDATWIHRFHPGDSWSFPGGDFALVGDACAMVGPALGFYTWDSPAMVDNVQNWLDEPGNNGGWILRGEEADPDGLTAQRFASREIDDITQRPMLIICFTPPAPCPGDADGSGVVDIDDVIQVILDFDMVLGECILLGDVDGNEVVDIDDVILVILNFGNACP